MKSNEKKKYENEMKMAWKQWRKKEKKESVMRREEGRERSEEEGRNLIM